MITLMCRRLARSQNAAGFATAAEIAQKTMDKFQKRYTDQSNSFEKRMEDIAKMYSEAPKFDTAQKIYQHPYDNDHNPLTFSWGKLNELGFDFMGPEQVSPHYENFMMSRKYALTFWGGLGVLIFMMTTADLHWMARSLIFPWTIYFFYLYWFLEGRKSLVKPLLGLFYRRIFNNEVKNLETYYNENIETKVRSMMAIAKGQLEYKTVHNDYKSVRNNSIMAFLVNEQINLQAHLNNRALNILKQTEAIEEVNQRKIIDKVLADVTNSLDKAYAENKEKIERDTFEMALKGLEKNEMDYKDDPILPYIIESINRNVNDFVKLTKEQQNNLIALTEEQLQQVRNSDARMRDEFLGSEPKIDGALKNNPTVAKILANWGKSAK